MDTEPRGSPGAALGHLLAYDAVRGRVVLFGGYSAGPTAFNDTWTWDGTSWTLLNPTIKPPGRALGTMAFDSLRGRMILLRRYRHRIRRPWRHAVAGGGSNTLGLTSAALACLLLARRRRGRRLREAA